MEIANWLVDQAVLFVLLLTRISGMVMTAPVFGGNYIPNQIKVGFSLILTLVFLPVLAPEGIPDQQFMNILLFAFMELMVGVAVGLLANLVFSAIQIAGQLLDVQMGFMMARVMDPQYEEQVPVIGQFKFMLAILVFLAINGHHMLIRAIYESYDNLPVGQLVNLGEGGIFLNEMFSTVFVLALQVSAPALGTLFLTNIALGILARTIPQMNVFIIGFPVKIFIGFLALLLLMPFYNLVLGNLFQNIWEGLHELILIL